MLCYMLALCSTNPRLKLASKVIKGNLAPTPAVEVAAREVTGGTEFGTVAGASGDMQENLALSMEAEGFGLEGWDAITCFVVGM